MQPNRVVQLGYPPLRIDLLTSVDGVAFDDCYANRVEVQLDEVVVPFIGLDDLRRNKTATTRWRPGAAPASVVGCRSASAAPW
jgi:hypothetical protein